MGQTIEQLRAERDRLKRQLRDAEDERDRLAEKLTERDEMLERQRDRADYAWCLVDRWQGHCEALKAQLEEEEEHRAALVRLATEREPAQRPGRPAEWTERGEAEVERMHAAGTSIRQIAAELGCHKTQIHRVLVRVRRRRAEEEEHRRLATLAAGQSPKQRTARAAERAARGLPKEGYDLVRVERYDAYLDNAAER